VNNFLRILNSCPLGIILVVGAVVFFALVNFLQMNPKKMFGSPVYIQTLEFKHLTITRRAHRNKVEG
jgi:hypothetical protein